MLFYGTVEELLDLLSGRDERMHLDRAALLLAAIEYPGLDPRPYLTMLDHHAAEVAARLDAAADGVEFVSAANRYLFDEQGFAGDSQDYYDPRNSCLNEVLIRRAGIPITLSLVYLEIARRLDRPLFGIGLPGHFLVQYDDGAFATFIDPFHAGALLGPADCFRVARETTKTAIRDDPALLARVTRSQIVLRMANNLRAVYLMRRAYNKALQVLNLLLAGDPASAEQYKQRALVHARMNRMSAARADLEHYLELAPAAPDRDEIEKQIRNLRKYIAGMN